MDRRSFVTALAGLPVVGFGSMVFGQPKPTEKSGITVHGPELIAFRYACGGPVRTSILADGEEFLLRSLSLRFENVPLRGNDPRELVKRLTPVFGIVNRSNWHWHGGVERARSLMFTGCCESSRENGLRRVVCEFTPVSGRPPWPGSHRPVDFEVEILKALTAGPIRAIQ